MIKKIKNLPYKYYFHQLRDVRVLGVIAFGVIALLVASSSLTAIETNYGLQKQIAGLQQENDIQQLQNNNQSLRNAYYNTNEFLELAARRQFGKAAPGETLVLIPKKVALAHASTVIDTKKVATSTVHNSKYQRNFQAWMDFFSHRLNTAS
jgi:cell division protein FtsB